MTGEAVTPRWEGRTARPLGDSFTFLVAGYGSGPPYGLHCFVWDGRSWRGDQLAQVDHLSALAAHPTAPVVYGVSGNPDGGWLHAWDTSLAPVSDIGTPIPVGREPCHVAVDDSGTWVAVTNYGSGSIAVVPLARDGTFAGSPTVLALDGSGPDARQESSHPHQAVFHDGHLCVPDLGADVVRLVDVCVEDGGALALSERRTLAVPPGTGPRHLVVLPDNRFALSGELTSSVMLLDDDDDDGSGSGHCAIVSSTDRSVGPIRNYPGDIRRSEDGRTIYVANRGLDTIAAFTVLGAHLTPLVEVAAGVQWPQHQHVVGDRLFVAGRESSNVVALSIGAHGLGAAKLQFDCPGASWLQPI